jgi:hypothetical protein
MHLGRVLSRFEMSLVRTGGGAVRRYSILAGISTLCAAVNNGVPQIKAGLLSSSIEYSSRLIT